MAGSYKRIIAIAGGTIIDIIKDKELILVPTTCGTGSEAKNIAILELKSRNTKPGLAVNENHCMDTA